MKNSPMQPSGGASVPRTLPACSDPLEEEARLLFKRRFNLTLEKIVEKQGKGPKGNLKSPDFRCNDPEVGKLVLELKCPHDDPNWPPPDGEMHVKGGGPQKVWSFIRESDLKRADYLRCFPDEKDATFGVVLMNCSRTGSWSDYLNVVQGGVLNRDGELLRDSDLTQYPEDRQKLLNFGAVFWIDRLGAGESERKLWVRMNLALRGTALARRLMPQLEHRPPVPAAEV